MRKLLALAFFALAVAGGVAAFTSTGKPVPAHAECGGASC
jgi:hypothetical protein